MLAKGKVIASVLICYQPNKIQIRARNGATEREARRKGIAAENKRRTRY